MYSRLSSFLHSPLACFALAISALIPVVCRAQPATQGAVIGQVSNAATSDNLEGVRVAIAGTNQEVTTDRQGFYALSGLAPGSYTITFEYPGLDRREVAVEVAKESRTRQDIALISALPGTTRTLFRKAAARTSARSNSAGSVGHWTPPSSTGSPVNSRCSRTS
jgi:hypothetical protein